MKSLFNVFEGIGLIGIGLGLVISPAVPQFAVVGVGIVLGVVGVLQLK